MPDADLVQRADAIHACATRAATDFATRGIPNTQLTALVAARDAFAAFAADEDLAGLASAAAAMKDAAREAVGPVASIRNMAEVGYCVRSLYKTFGFIDLVELPDNDLLRSGRRIQYAAGRPG